MALPKIIMFVVKPNLTLFSSSFFELLTPQRPGFRSPPNQQFITPKLLNPLMTTIRKRHNIFVIFLRSCIFSLIETKMKKYLKIYFRFPSNGKFPYGNNGHKQYRNYKMKRQFACFVSHFHAIEFSRSSRCYLRFDLSSIVSFPIRLLTFV